MTDPLGGTGFLVLLGLSGQSVKKAQTRVLEDIWSCSFGPRIPRRSLGTSVTP